MRTFAAKRASAARTSLWEQVREGFTLRDIQDTRKAGVAGLLACSVILILVGLDRLLRGENVVLWGQTTTTQVSLVNSVLGPVLLVLYAWGYWHVPRKYIHTLSHTMAFGGQAACAWSAISARDGSVVAQVYFYFALLVTAYVAKPLVARLLWGFTVVVQGITLLLVPSPGSPVSDWISMALVMGGMTIAVGWMRDASDRARAKLRSLAELDSLTGLQLRASLDTALARLNHRGPVKIDANTEGVALLEFDVDRFKHINDEFGHPGGDAVLRELASRIHNNLPEGAFAARIGGDEIVVYIPHVTAAQADQVAHAMLEAVRREPMAVGEGMSVPVSVSIGVAHWPSHAATGRELYLAADAALLRAKAEGAGRAHSTGHAATSSHAAQ